MAPQEPAQVLMLVAQQVMAMPPTILGHALQGPRQTFPGGLADHDPDPTPGAFPQVREAQEVKRVVDGFPGPTRTGRYPAEIHEARLGRVERQALLGQPLFHDLSDPLGVLPALEHTDRIVGKADHAAAAPQTRDHFPMEPFVQDIMQKDVRQEG